MGDGNEQRLSNTVNASNSVPPSSPEEVTSVPEPLWRFRPPPVARTMVRALKSQILPRLTFWSKPAERPPHTHLADDDLPRFVALILDGDDDTPAAFVACLVDKGIAVSDILLHLFEPAARQLGKMWQRDTTDFAQVTLAVSRLQRLMRQLVEKQQALMPHQVGGSALLTTVSDEQHSFGMLMAAEFFARAGWTLCLGPFASQAEFVTALNGQWLDIVGFSVSSDRKLDRLASDIALVRRHSRNRKVGIILGGQMVREHPELAAHVGADMVSVDVTIAPRHAHALVEVMRNRD